MREIIFRGKDNVSRRHEWCFGSLVCWRNKNPEIKGYDIYRTGHDEFLSREVIRDSVGQYTGVHDKNGNEIYEGDIVRFYSVHFLTRSEAEYFTKYSIIENIGEVILHQCRYTVEVDGHISYLYYLSKEFGNDFKKPDGAECINQDKFPNISLDDFYIVEVIGNIHDNPDLHKGEKE